MAGELFSGGVARRSCCDSYGNEWHARPCNVNGPTGLGPSGVGCFSPVPSARCGGDGCRGCAWCEHVGPKVVETDLIPPGPILVGEFTFPGTDIVQELAGCAGAHHTSDGICVGHSPGELVGCAMESVGIDFGYDARALALIPHRWCCGGLPTDRHLNRCPTNFFAEGQTVIKPDLNVMDPWGRARLRIAEDRVSSDRTFENETRPL